MRRIKTIAILLLFALFLGALDFASSASGTYYSADIPTWGDSSDEEKSFLDRLNTTFGSLVTPVRSQSIPINLTSEENNRLEYKIMTGEDFDDIQGAERFIASKAQILFEDTLRDAGFEDNEVNIYLVSGDDYKIILEPSDLSKISEIKNTLPSQITFENGWYAWIRNQNVRRGLDLQGGIQLDYKVDLSRVEQGDVDSVVQGNLAVVERRVNELGVAEPNIYVSDIADEKHIIVELAGIRDIEEAKAVIGKTVQLEFKEQRSADEKVDESEMKDLATEAIARINEGGEFKTIGLEYHRDYYDDNVRFSEPESQFTDEIFPTEVKDVVETMEPGQVYPTPIEATIALSLDQENNIIAQKGFVLVKLIETGEAEREVEDPAEEFATVAEEVYTEKDIEEDINYQWFKVSELPENLKTYLDKYDEEKLSSEVIEEDETYAIYSVGENQPKTDEQVRASHILIAYQGAERASAEVTRTKEEARTLAAEVLDMTKQEDADFAALASEYSDGPSGANGGDLDFFGKGVMAKPFEEAAFSLQTDEISEPVETTFGFHIIKKTDEKPAEERKVLFQRIALPKTEENKTYLENILTTRLRTETKTETAPQAKIQTLTFPLEGGIWKSTGLDGTHFKHASVELDQNTFDPYVAISFDDEGAEMFSELTGRLKGKRLAIFVGGQLISAPSVNEKIPSGVARITGDYTLASATELADNLNSGAIPAPLELVSELKISALLGNDAFDTSVWAGILGLLVVAIYMVLYYRLPGFIAVIALLFYAGILITLLKYSGAFGMPIVLTLAGVAGLILSVGMAVDANVLIFERLKEELRSGKNMSSALALAYERAWTSIRDSNISSLIICVILYLFGSSIIKGFAVMLFIGIIISMFTAIVITKSILRLFLRTSISKNRWLFGDKVKKD